MVDAEHVGGDDAGDEGVVVLSYSDVEVIGEEVLELGAELLWEDVIPETLEQVEAGFAASA